MALEICQTSSKPAFSCNKWTQEKLPTTWRDWTAQHRTSPEISFDPKTGKHTIEATEATEASAQHTAKTCTKCKKKNHLAEVYRSSTHSSQERAEARSSRQKSLSQKDSTGCMKFKNYSSGESICNVQQTTTSTLYFTVVGCTSSIIGQVHTTTSPSRRGSHVQHDANSWLSTNHWQVTTRHKYKAESLRRKADQTIRWRHLSLSQGQNRQESKLQGPKNGANCIVVWKSRRGFGPYPGQPQALSTRSDRRPYPQAGRCT